MEKVTKKQMFEGMVAYFTGEDTAISEAQFVEFCKGQIADLDKKAAKAKERAAAKRAESDELTDVVYGVLTEEFQTIADIADAVAAELGDAATDVTAAKITARLTKLFKAESIEKDQISVEIDGKKTKKMAYRLAGVVDADEVEVEE